MSLAILNESYAKILNSSLVIKNAGRNINPDLESENSTFEIKTHEIIPEKDLNDRQVLVRIIYFSNDPAQVYWSFSPAKDYGRKAQIGEPFAAKAVAQVVASKSSDVKVGRHVVAMMFWSKYHVLGENDAVQGLVDESLQIPLNYHISPLSMGSASGFCSLVKIAGLKESDEGGKTFMFSGAAGNVGITTIQIVLAIYKPKRIYAIAGGPKKVKFLNDLDSRITAIDYKIDNFASSLKDTLKGEEIDIYFDNVGGPILEAVIYHMKVRGIIIGCGQISGYLDPTPQPFYALNLVITKRLRFEGFIVTDYMDIMPWIMETLARLLKEGKVSATQTIVDCKGDKFKEVPKAFMGLFEGSNIGKLVTQIAEE